MITHANNYCKFFVIKLLFQIVGDHYSMVALLNNNVDVNIKGLFTYHIVLGLDFNITVIFTYMCLMDNFLKLNKTSTPLQKDDLELVKKYQIVVTIICCLNFFSNKVPAFVFIRKKTFQNFESLSS